MFSRLLALAAALVVSSGFALAQTPAPPTVPTYDYPGAHTANGAPDPGTPTTAGGVTTTTYQDGWTKTVEPDNGFTPPGTKTTIKDPQGRTREILRKDNLGTMRHHMLIEYEKGLTTTHNWGANGVLIDSTKETETPGQPKKTERWNPETGRYVLAAADSPAPGGGILASLSTAALLVAALTFLIGLFIGKAWGARTRTG